MCKYIHGDSQFEKIRKSLDGKGINLNIPGRDEHVPKSFIRTLRERVQAIANELPFVTYLHWLIEEMVHNVIFMKTAFLTRMVYMTK